MRIGGRMEVRTEARTEMMTEREDESKTGEEISFGGKNTKDTD